MPDRTFPRHVFEVPRVSGSFRNISVCICRYAPVCFGAKSMLLCPMSACLTYSIWILFIRQSRFHSLWPAVSLFFFLFFYFSSLQLTSCDFYLRSTISDQQSTLTQKAEQPPSWLKAIASCDSLIIEALINKNNSVFASVILHTVGASKYGVWWAKESLTWS